MARILLPRDLMSFFNLNREIQRFFERLAFSTPNSESESDTKLINNTEYTLTSFDGSITIDASLNSVKISLPAPNLYKGKIYRIDVKDATNTVLISGNLNNVVQNFEMFKDESLIIQDNGESYRVK